MNKDEEKRQKLFSACIAGDRFALMEVIKSQHIYPSTYDMVDDQGKTALHVACRYGHIDIVRTLVEIYGCSPQAVDNSGSTPFHDACYYDQVVVCDYIIHTTPDPTECLLVADIKGNTPFHKANEAGSSYIVNYLLHMILTGKTPKKIGLAMDHNIIQFASRNNCSSHLLVRNKVGDTPIAVACRHGHIGILKMYMQYHDLLKSHNVYASINNLLRTASKCGQFAIVHYLQGAIKESYVSVESQVRARRVSRIRLAPMIVSYSSEHVVTSPGIAWNIVNFSNKNPFCMALLQGDEEYINAFRPVQSFCSHTFSAAVITDTLENFVGLFIMHMKWVKGHGSALLYIACEWGSIKAANYLISLLSSEIDISNIRNKHNETPLHVACKHGRGEIVELLLKSGSYDAINSLSHHKETPLHLACLHANPLVVKLILDSNQVSNLDAPDKFGDTPLMNACYSGNSSVVELLIDKGCNPFYVNSFTKETTVHIACKIQRPDILQLLSKNVHNAEVDLRNHLGKTPLSIAMSMFCTDVVHVLVSQRLCDVTQSLFSEDSNCKDASLHVRAANPSICDRSVEFAMVDSHCGDLSRVGNAKGIRATSCKSCRSNYHSISKLPAGFTALHLACVRNDHKLVQLLLKYCPVNVVDSVGNTPLHIAAKGGNFFLMKTLLDNLDSGVDEFVNDNGDSALHLACEARSSIVTVKLLLDTCNVTLKNKSGNTPIHLACQHTKSATLIGHLINKCSGNLDCHINNENNTFLHVASKVSDLDTIKLLLRHCSPICQNANGDTPIHIACRSNRLLTIECLLDKAGSSSPEPLVNNSGQTILHAACNSGAKLKIIEAIFDKGHGSLGNIQDTNGNTPLHYVCHFGQLDCFEFLMTSNHCDPHKFNNHGISPLFYAIMKKQNFQLIECVVAKQLCDLNRPVKTGLPFLHSILIRPIDRANLHDIIMFVREELLDEYDHFLIKSGDERTSLQFLKVLKILKGSNGRINLNATDKCGNTVLHLACQLEQYLTVKMLLSTEGANQSVCIRNNNDKTPIQLTNDYRIIRLLISYGANPEDVYHRFATILQISKAEQPLDPAVKIIVLGNSTAGKTTLVEALTSIREDPRVMIQVEGSTSGMKTSEHNSEVFGRVTFHDFAGQPEFESSHSVFLERCSSSLQPPLFLLVVDSSEYQYVERQIHYWLSFIQNHCNSNCSTPPHVIVVGSHVDKVKDIQMSRVKNLFSKAIESFKASVFECFDPVFLDCRKISTDEMKALQLRVKDSCSSLKSFIEFDCRCHILFTHLVKWFHTESFIKVKELQCRIRKRQAKPEWDHRYERGHLTTSHSSEVLLPISTDPLVDLLRSLHAGGHILFLDGDSLEDSWIVMNQDALFKTVNGVLFAPKDFERHLELDNNTGMVPLAKLKCLFPDLNFNLVRKFLLHYEFCKQVEDVETLELIHGSSELQTELGPLQSIYYFFPGLIKSDKPTNLWNTPEDSPYSFSCGWMLQCQSNQFFETRFLHVLLLRLTFYFVESSSKSSVFKRKCNIWKNGIHWGTRSGVEVLVELVEEKSVLLVLVRCYHGQELESVKLRTAVLKKVWQMKTEFCSKVNADEYLIHPSVLSMLLTPQNLNKDKISLSEIAQTVVEGSQFVVCPSSIKPLPLDTLLYYEPYSRMDKEHVALFFTKKVINEEISNETLYTLSVFLHPVYQHLVKVLKIPITDLGYHKDKWQNHPVKMLHHLFDSWKSRREQPTFATLRSEFDEYSIFFGRDPQVGLMHVHTACS